MRKRQIIPILQGAHPSDQAWLDMDRNILVEVTSEEKGCPIESALPPDENEKRGWRAANPGTHIIRLIFDEPQVLRRIWLVFEDTESTRTQKFVLRWSPGTSHSFREIATPRVELQPVRLNSGDQDYTVDLSDVAVLELITVPDKADRDARASLRVLRVA
jgi:hypothetical protein